MAPLLLSFGHCSRHFADSRPAGPDVYNATLADADRYHRLQFFLSLLGFGLSIAFLLALIFTDAGHGLARVATRVTTARWAQVALVALALGAGQGVLTLPLTLIRGFWLPRRFGLLHQSFVGWLADQLKAALIGGALGLAAVEIVYALLALTPLWWAAAAAVFIAAQIAMTAVLADLDHSALLPSDAARRQRPPRSAAGARATGRGGGDRRLRCRPVEEEPHRERRGRRPRPHAANHSLRHLARRVPTRGDRIRPRPRARTPRPRRYAPRAPGATAR